MSGNARNKRESSRLRNLQLAYGSKSNFSKGSTDKQSKGSVVLPGLSTQQNTRSQTIITKSVLRKSKTQANLNEKSKLRRLTHTGQGAKVKAPKIYGFPVQSKNNPFQSSSFKGLRGLKSDEEKRRRSNASVDIVIHAMKEIETGSFGENFATPRISKTLSFTEFSQRAQSLSPDELFHLVHGLFRTLKQYRSLLEVTSLISVELDSGDALRKIIEGTYSVVSVERVTLYLVNVQKGTVNMVLSKDGEEVVVPIGQGLAGTVAKTLETLVIEDAYKDSRFDPSVDRKTGFNTRNMIVVPVLDVYGECTAVLQCINKLDDSGQYIDFLKEDAFLLQIVAASAGHCIHKLRVTEEALMQQEKTAVLFNVVKAIQSEGDVNQLIERLINVAYDMMRCDRITLYLCDQARREIWCAIISPDTVGFRIPFGVGISGWVAEHGKLLNIPDAYKDKRFIRDVDVRTGYRTRSILAMPITDGDGVVGVFQLINKFASSGDHVLEPLPKNLCVGVKNKQSSPDFTTFNEKDVNLCESFCSEIGAALRRKVLEVRFKKVIADFKHISVGNVGSAQLIRSLLSTHTKTDIDHKVRIKSFIRAFQAIGKFMLVLKRYRGPLFANNVVPDAIKNIDVALIMTRTLPNQALIDSAAFQSEDHSDASKQLQTEFAKLDFDVLGVEDGILIRLAEHVLNRTGLMKRYRIPHRVLLSFLLAVKSAYLKNPYHNFIHAMFVFQKVYAVLVNSKAMDRLLFVDIFTLLISALCHDIGHTGRTNDFEIKTKSELSITYNDASVLEQHHAATTFRILNQPGNNILACVSEATYGSIRKSIIANILATDMKTHFDQVKTAKEDIPKSEIHNRESPEYRLCFSTYLLHCCDIGAQASPMDIAAKWGDLVIQEFSEQAKEEQKLGLAPTPHMHGLDKPKQLAQVQIGFIEYIVTPAFEVLVLLLPECSSFITNLSKNKNRYKSLLIVGEGPIHKKNSQRSKDVDVEEKE